MTERPILFSAPMIRAILAGVKTQTRRVVKLPHENPLGKWEPTTFGGPNGGRTRKGETIPERAALWHTRTGESISPRFLVGDRLWVRETWRAELSWQTSKPSDIPAEAAIFYEADGQQRNNGMGCKFRGKLRPSMFMPRWASRITLEITGVRVERLQDISEADARAEGAPIAEFEEAFSIPPSMMTQGGFPNRAHRYGFQKVWGAINGADSWHANPWVWRISFKRVTP